MNIQSSRVGLAPRRHQERVLLPKMVDKEIAIRLGVNGPQWVSAYVVSMLVRVLTEGESAIGKNAMFSRYKRRCR